MKEKALKVLRENGLDAMLITDRFNRRYLSGFTGSAGMLYVSEKRQVVLTDSRYEEQVKRECCDFDGFCVRDRDYVVACSRMMEEDGAKRVGFEDETILLKEYLDYENRGIQEELIGLGKSVNVLRALKETWEIERIRKAEEIGDQAFAHILDILRPGITEREIAIELDYTMLRLGAERLSFDTIAASGLNSALPHAQPTDKKIESGDFVTMDFGCVYQGDCSDMTRTVVIGHASAIQKAVYDTVLRAQEAALAVAGPGRPASEADTAARTVIADAGYGEFFGHALGHSLGLFMHEEPGYGPTCHTIVEPTMLMTVEPGIYIPGFGGVRIEDLIVITENGYENLTHSDKRLIEL